MNARIARVDTDRAIHIVEPDGSSELITSVVGDGLMWGNWSAAKVEPTSHTWPTFSPDGTQIACFALTSQQGNVLVSDLAGVQSQVVIELPGQLPIYPQWSPDGERIGVVSQLGDDLRLTVGWADGRAAQRVVTTGSPLFYTWTSDNRMATFVGGGSANAKMMLLDPDDRTPTSILQGIPGDFCAPVRVGDDVIYSAHYEGKGQILRHDNGETRTYKAEDGLMAFVASNDHTKLARAVAKAGDGSPYTRLTVLDLETGEETVLAHTECLAFVWTGDDSGIVVARVDSDRGLVEWVLLGLDGSQIHLVDVIPSRDMRFYLRFFEQYAASHPIVDPDGTWLLVSGARPGVRGGPRVFRVSLDGRMVEDIGPGHFACFGPRIFH